MKPTTPRALLLAILLGATLLALAAICWQHLRYLHARRQLVQDHQAMLYPSSALHVVTVAKLAPGADLFEETRRLVAALEDAGGHAVYAGRCLLVGLQSSQLPRVEWDLALLVQFPSRDAWEQARRRPEVEAARARFAHHYDLGMRRSAWGNLAVPVALLVRRFWDVLNRHPARYPFQPAADFPPRSDPEALERARRLEALRDPGEWGRDAAVVVNFVQQGSAEQREHDADYVGEMLGLMAEQAHGPMHMGRAVTLEGDARFDQVALVYYPGAAYFAEMAASSFYGAIMGDKQLGDSLAMITAPFLDRL